LFSNRGSTVVIELRVLDIASTEPARRRYAVVERSRERRRSTGREVKMKVGLALGLKKRTEVIPRRAS
jgi:hypothetical protein